MFARHSKGNAQSRTLSSSLPRKAVSLFAAFTLAFGLFPAHAFADDTPAVQQFTLGGTSAPSAEMQGVESSTDAGTQAAVPSLQSTAAGSPAASDAEGEDIGIGHKVDYTIEEGEVIEISSEPLNLVQNGNYEGVDTAANASTNIASTGASAPTTAQRNALKARLNTAFMNVSYSSYAGQSNWCVLDVKDIMASVGSQAAATPYAKALVEEVVNDNPDLFYVGAKYGTGTMSSGGNTIISKILVQYYYSPSTIKTMKSRYETAMQGIMKWVPAGKSDAEKAKAVHDWLVRNVSYNTSAANKGGPENYGSWDPWSAYGAAVGRKAVCEGYSLCFISAMKRLGIQATFVTNANHGWNRVRLYDTLASGSSPNYYWFNLDVTWDDPLPDKGFSNTPNTTYFLKSDSYFKSNNTGSFGEHKKWTPAGTAGTNTKYDRSWPGGVYSGNASRGTVTSISLSPNALSLAPDSSQQLTLNVAQSGQVNPGEAKWTSSNSAVAAVSSSGMVTAGKATGTATITVELGGKRTTCTVTVKSGVQLSNASISLSTSNYSFVSGKSQRPSPTVKVNGATLREGVDYKITWPSDTVNPGTKTATITGMGNYTGTKTFSYKITAPVKQASISPKSGGSYNYTGSAVKPTITLKVGGYTLQEGTDYTLSWPSNATSTGTKTVTINGKGAYTGTTTWTYKITGTQIAKASVSYEATKRYTGKAVTQNPTLTLNGSTIPSSNYSISYKNNVQVGTATMTITGKGNFTGTVTKTFKIVNSSATWTRLAGANKFATMQKVVGTGWAKNSGGTVVIATSAGFQDALSAAAVAGKYNAPVLITEYNRLTSQTKAELDRIRPSNIIIVGGKYVVTPAVESTIRSLSYVKSVTRKSGNSASDTAATLAETYFPKGTTTTAILASSQDYHDALSASPISYAKGYPIFLVDSYKSISKRTLEVMRKIGIKNVMIVGGKWMVDTDSNTVIKQLKNYGVTNIDRKAGAKYWDSALLIANWGLSQGLSANKMGVATGVDYSDALCGAALCGKNNSILVLTEHNKARCTTIAKSNKNSITQGYVFGGIYVVQDNVKKAFEDATK